MLTYQIRKRIYRISEGDALQFPNSTEVIFQLAPLQPFGMEPGNGRTCIRAVGAQALFNANTGQHTIQSEKPLHPLEVIIDETPIREVELKGSLLTIRMRVQSLEELDELVQSIFYGFPMLLNIEFADPPTVTQVYGKIGDVLFKWELTDWQMEFETTTQDEQEAKAANSWLRFNVISEPSRRRLIAALHYFHIACRLTRVGNSPWEFMGEAILNFSKVLEVLFPSEGEGKTIEAAREGLKELGYSMDEIERDFVPAIALRNGIDVGHVHLSLLKQTHLQILHKYTDAAEHTFRLLMRRILDRVADDSYVITPYSASKAGPEVTRIITRMEHYYRE